MDGTGARSPNSAAHGRKVVTRQGFLLALPGLPENRMIVFVLKSLQVELERGKQ